jgi:uncharacterized surface protein with fasciclin (FAS1) repeats
MRMKSIGLILLGILGGTTPVLYGQDAAQPSVDLYEGAKQPNITPTPIPYPEPNGPNIPELPQLDEAFKPKSLGKEVDERRIHIQWRQLKNRVENDSQVRAAKAFAQAARTDLERRNRFRNYYDIYYTRMSALASSPELKVALEALKSAHVGLLAQPHVRPSPSASPASDAAKIAGPNLPNQATPAPVNAPSPQTQGKAATTVATKSAGLSLSTFLTATNLPREVAILKENAPVTVFAPTDDAFQKAPPSTIDFPLNAEKIGKLLDYHIVKGAVTSNELTTRKAPTINGASLDIKVINGEIMVNDAHVLKADVKFPGGVIYVIDKVLIPPAK